MRLDVEQPDYKKDAVAQSDLTDGLGVWMPIETAPKDKRVLVWSGQEIYAAQWAKHMTTDDESWIVAQWGDEGEQALVKPTHWMPLPKAPNA